MKYILLGILVFIFYRLVFKPKKLQPPPKEEPLQEPGDDKFADYEELD